MGGGEGLIWEVWGFLLVFLCGRWKSFRDSGGIDEESSISFTLSLSHLH